MASQGSAPAAPRSAEQRALARVGVARRLRRATLVVGLALLVVGYLRYGARWVPAGMDTVPAVPPGTFCVIAKQAGSVQVGSHVFVELPDGREVFSRVATRSGDEITILHPNPHTGWPDSRTLGPLPLSAVRGLVLGAFKPR
ncbi:MAG: hypothetical protein KDE27_02480 [Planctomycetes bacterium]|nr:hypothetical protein [Planctomycetota bacterium]